MRNTRSTVTQASYLFARVCAFVLTDVTHKHTHRRAHALRSSERAGERRRTYGAVSVHILYIVRHLSTASCPLLMLCAHVCVERGGERESGGR